MKGSVLMEKSLEKMNELKKAIIDNPNLPLRFFVSEDTNCGEYPYEENYISKIVVEGLVLYNGQYYNKEDFGEKLFEYMHDEFDSEEELNKHIDEIIKTKNLEKTICVFIG